jgi:hypothetical protein
MAGPRSSTPDHRPSAAETARQSKRTWQRTPVNRKNQSALPADIFGHGLAADSVNPDTRSTRLARPGARSPQRAAETMQAYLDSAGKPLLDPLTEGKVD